MTIKNPSIKLSILAVFFLVVCLSACSHWQGDQAKIVISFGSAVRAIEYRSDDTATHQALEHQIVLSNKRETLNFQSKGTATFEAYAAPGAWTVWIYSRLDGEIYAAGTLDVDLQAGRDNILKIPMYQALVVQFNTNGGSEIPDQIVPKGYPVAQPSDPQRDGYAFGGWYADAGLEAPYDFTNPVNSGITLYTKWNGIWWTWDSTKRPDDEDSYESTTRVAITSSNDTGCDVTVTGVPNGQYYNWASQVGYNYPATVGKTYKATWKWKTNDNKAFRNVTIRYTQGDKQDGTDDHYYQLGTNEEKLTIPAREESKTYQFTMPGNCLMSFTFYVGEDTGSFTISNFEVREVDTGTNKIITFTHSKGDSGSDGDPYDNWVGLYDIPSSVRGTGIKAGDKFTFTYEFTSDVTINDYITNMNIILLDNSETARPPWWKELSDYENSINGIQANDKKSGTIVFTATGTASSSAADANRLAFLINPADAVARHPTLTFTRFEFTNGGDAPPAPSGPVTVPGNNLTAKLDWLGNNAKDGGEYIVTVTGNESIDSGNWLGYGPDNKYSVTITLTGDGTVSLNDVKKDNMFNIGPNVTLILEYITLKGRSDNRSPLVGVGGTLIMEEGAVITGNHNNRNDDGPGGGGVGVGVEGRFFMNGGTISNNKTIFGYGGGGVDIYGGEFVMTGGIITGNHSGISSGGVSVNGGEKDGKKIPATFNMFGGTISDNKALGLDGDGGYDGGVSIGLEVEFTMSGTAKISKNNAQHSGGVGVWGGTFTMEGGEIFGNIANLSGGGVHIHEGKDDDGVIFTPTFNMNGGRIYGNTAGTGGGGIHLWNGNFNKKATGGTITGNNANEGKQIQANGEYPNAPKNRNSDVLATEALSFIYNGTDRLPTVSGKWDDGENSEVFVSERQKDEPFNGLTTTGSTYQIVNLPQDNRQNVMKVKPSAYSNNGDWAVVKYSLSAFRNTEITIALSVDVKMVGDGGPLNWQINNNPDYPSVALEENTKAGTWHTMEGTWTGIPSENYPELYLTNYNNINGNATYYIDNFTVTIKVKTPIIITAPAYGTLFDAVGSFAGKRTFNYYNKEWWVVAHMNYNWANVEAEWDSAKNNNGTPGNDDYHTRIAYQLPLPSGHGAENYDEIIITYDMILIGGHEQIYFRNSSKAQGGADPNFECYFDLPAGTDISITIPIYPFYNDDTYKTDHDTEDGWIGIVKGDRGIDGTDAGAMLLRITKIEIK